MPILLLNEERFEKKLGFYFDFENLSFNLKPIKTILNVFMAI